MLLSLLLGLAAVQAPQPPLPPAVQEDILVVGEKLKTWRGRMSPAGTSIRCVTTTSTGDSEIDHIGCSAMVTCFTPLRPRMEAALARRRPARERDALTAPIYRELGTCLAARHDRLVADLAERRYQARQGSNNAVN